MARLRVHSFGSHFLPWFNSEGTDLGLNQLPIGVNETFGDSSSPIPMRRGFRFGENEILFSYNLAGLDSGDDPNNPNYHLIKWKGNFIYDNNGRLTGGKVTSFYRIWGGRKSSVGEITIDEIAYDVTKEYGSFRTLSIPEEISVPIGGTQSGITGARNEPEIIKHLRKLSIGEAYRWSTPYDSIPAESLETTKTSDSNSVSTDILQAIKVPPVVRSSETFDSQVDDYKVGKNTCDRIRVTPGESGMSWALWGLGGNDTLIGGKQNDFLIGGDGNDVLTGGAGEDLFILSERNKSVDTIKDFSPKQDSIGISTKLIGANTTDNAGVVKYQDVKNKNLAEKHFKSQGMDNYVLVDSFANIKNLNGSGYIEKIRLAIDLTSNRILYDADGNWARGSIEMAKLDGKSTSGSWSASNFAFGIEVN